MTKEWSEQPVAEKGSQARVIAFTSGMPREVENVLASELEGRTEGLTGCCLTLDFTKVERISSAELGTLVTLHSRLAAAGGRLTLVNLNEDVASVFAATRLDSLLAIRR